ncbi:hypothetical protein [Streptomyces sp. DG1A-41]|uniref:hypothetical protein n=1 Tax=Streptomyces sp. DG1A-41 TaxID=3125779 RepID=UPI0030CC7F50
MFEALAAIGIEGEKGRRGVEFASEVMRDGPGWRAEADLPPGVEATAALEKRAALAAAVRRPISTVWPEADRTAHPGRLVLWVAQRDPAKAGRKLWPLMKDGQADVYEPLPFGFDPRGNLVEITLMYSSLLVGGVPARARPLRARCRPGRRPRPHRRTVDLRTQGLRRPRLRQARLPPVHVRRRGRGPGGRPRRHAVRDRRVPAPRLKPFRVSTRQLTIRECCGGAKGLRWADLPTPEDGEHRPPSRFREG